MLPTLVMFPSLTLSDVPTIPNVPAAALLAPIVVPSIDPPSILAVVTVPRSAIVVPKVEFLPKIICSLSSVVLNLMYELLP